MWLAALALVAYFGILPIAILLARSLGGAGPLGVYTSVSGAAANVRALVSTLVVSGGTAFVALALGLPMGLLVAATDLPGARLWRGLFTLPYVVPPYIGALAWTYLASGRSGWLNDLARALLGPGAPTLEVYSGTGMVLVMGMFFSPLVMMGVAEACTRIDAALVEAARLAGASPARALADVTWPLVRRPALGGAALTFLAAAASYGVPALLGPSAEPPVTVLTTRIKGAIDLHTTGGFYQAMALCWPLLAMALAFPAAGALGGIEAVGVTSRPGQGHVFALGRLRRPLLAAVALLAGLAVLLPLATLIVSSLLANVGLGLTWSNLSWVHWRTVLGRKDALAAVTNSLVLAAGAATAALLVGGVIAYFEVRSGSPARWLAGAAASVPYATPGTVLAIGLILTFLRGWGLNLYGSMTILLVAYTVKELALAYRLMRDGLAQVHPSMEEAARTSGASWGRAVLDVLLPMVRGDLVAAWFLVFMPSFGELTMSILLFGPETQTVGTLLFELTSYEDPAAASVLAVIIVGVVLVSSAAVRRASGARYGL